MAETKSADKTANPAPSPADQEIHGGGLAPPGETIIVKQNPETPTSAQIEASQGEVAGPAETVVTVTDGSGEEIPHRLGTDDQSLIRSRAIASQSNHPSHTTPGWSNPNLAEPSDKEKEADQKEYAKRFGN